MKKAQYLFEMTFCLYLLGAVVFAQSLVDEGRQLFNEKKYAEAKAIFDRVVKSNPNEAQPNYFLGRITLHFGDYDQAQEYLEKAVQIDGGNIDYHLALAKVYSEKARRASFLAAARWAGKWKAELEKAFAIDPKNLDARSQLIYYYLNAPAIGGGDKDKGQRLAEETIEFDPIRGRLLLAHAFKQSGKIELAVAEYEKVLKLDPKHRASYNNLGYIFLKKKNYDAAELNFKKYVEVAPDDPNAYDSLGDYYSERGKTDEAMAQYQQALEVDSTFSPSRFKLAQAYEKKQMKQDAIHHYETLIALSPADTKAEEAEKRLKNLRR